MSRGENAVRVDAMKGSEPRTRARRCGLEWHRDRCATFALALAYAKITKSEALRKALLEWLNEHPRALLS